MARIKRVGHKEIKPHSSKNYIVDCSKKALGEVKHTQSSFKN